MKLEDILKEWDIDSEIDLTDLNNTARHVQKLHAKYLRLHAIEKVKLKKLQAEMRTFRLQKYEHYTQGPSPETRDWKLPAAGRILKNEAKDWYIDADQDINNKQMIIDIQQEKVDALESIMKMIQNRGFLINTITNFTKWTEGG